MIVIVRSNMMQLKVVVNDGMRMMPISLMHVIWHNRQRECDVGAQYQADNPATQQGRHAGVIIVADGT